MNNIEPEAGGYYKIQESGNPFIENCYVLRRVKIRRFFRTVDGIVWSYSKDGEFELIDSVNWFKKRALYKVNTKPMQTPKNNKATDKGSVGEELIKHMVGRFLGWKIPQDFNPDAGISFKAEYGENGPYPGKHEPVGTNLLDAVQAEEMVRYMLEDFNFEAEATTPSLSEGEENKSGASFQRRFDRNIEWAFRAINDDGEDVNDTLNLLRTNLLALHDDALSQTRQEERERAVVIGEELKKEVDLGEFPPQIDLKDRIANNAAITTYQQKIKSLND